MRPLVLAVRFVPCAARGPILFWRAGFWPTTTGFSARVGLRPWNPAPLLPPPFSSIVGFVPALPRVRHEKKLASSAIHGHAAAVGGIVWAGDGAAPQPRGATWRGPRWAARDLPRPAIWRGRLWAATRQRRTIRRERRWAAVGGNAPAAPDLARAAAWL